MTTVPRLLGNPAWAVLIAVTTAAVAACSPSAAPRAAGITPTTQVSPATPSTQVSPLGLEYSNEDVSEIIRQVESGVFFDAPEANKTSAVAGQWEQAFGMPATSTDIMYLKDISRLLEADLAEGRNCSYFDDVFDELATAVASDRGRTEYVFSAAAMVWIRPDLAARLLRCFP